jgi:hypothetical protein
MSQCPYAYALGVPGEGFHAARLGPIALNDTLGTIALAAATSWIFKVSFLWSFVAWFVAGELLHWIAGTPTAFLRLTGLTRSCS